MGRWRHRGAKYLPRVTRVGSSQPGFKQPPRAQSPGFEPLCRHPVRVEGPSPSRPVSFAPPTPRYKDRAQASDRGAPLSWCYPSFRNILLAFLSPNQAILSITQPAFLDLPLACCTSTLALREGHPSFRGWGRAQGLLAESLQPGSEPVRPCMSGAVQGGQREGRPMCLLL